MNDTEARSYIDNLRYMACRDQFPQSNPQRDWVIWHEMVAPERHDMAESLGRYFANPERKASTHFGVDDDSAVRYADLSAMVYGTERQGNTRGIHIEQAGLGNQTVGEWDDPYSRKMIDEQTSRLTAAVCVLYDIPIVHVDPDGLRRGERGITTHYEMCQAFMQGNKSQWHYDPKNMPIGRAIGKTREWATGTQGDDDMPYRDWTVEDKDALASDVARKVREEINGWLDAQRGPGKHGNGKNLDDVIDAVSQRIMASDQHPNLGDVINEIRGNPTAP